MNALLTDAISKRASDIHVEPYEKMLRVRFRIDGVLYEIMQPPLKLKNAITSRIKVMAPLDIAERRLPQDGRIKLKLGSDKEMDFRVSVLPTIFGEKVVLRLLDKSNLQLDMTKLGFEEQALERLQGRRSTSPSAWCWSPARPAAARPPRSTRRSPSSTRSRTNISTAEDPVEFNLVGINQVQMHEEIGLNFAAALRAFLRQDPDIIMVGEIRDFETAEIAVKAALTGHLVLSHAAHQRRARRPSTGCSTWASSRSWSRLGQPHHGAAPGARDLPAAARRTRRSRPRRWSSSACARRDRVVTRCVRGAGCATAAAPATAAASRSTR